MLRDLTLQLPRGKLSLIVGAVGAGKTSVLAACLGEMVRTDTQTHGRPAAPSSRGCNTMHSRLQPHALEAATPCTRAGCMHMHMHVYMLHAHVAYISQVRTDGDLALQRRIAYVPQRAWW